MAIWISWASGPDGGEAGDGWTFAVWDSRTNLRFTQREFFNPQGIVHWLLELSGGKEVLRFADVDLNIQDKRSSSETTPWTAGLEVADSPSISVDPYATGRASTGNVSITIVANRLQDYTAASNITWAQVYGVLYRWAEGTPYEEAQPLLIGTVENFVIGAEGESTFDLVDLSVSLNSPVPLQVVDTDTWASARGEHEGQGYPVRYGSFSRAAGPEVDTANKYVVAAGHSCNTISTMYLDDTEDVAATSTDTTDSNGETVHVITYNDATAGKQPNFSGQGPVDDDAGTYTGTAGALVNHPGSIMAHLALEVLGMPAQHFETAQFMNTLLTHPAWEYCLNVDPTDETTWLDVAGDMARWMRCAVWFNAGSFTIRHLDFDAQPVVALDAGNIVKVHSIADPGNVDVVNDLVLLYDWTYLPRTGEWAYQGAVHLGADNDAKCAWSQRRYPKRRLILEQKAINDSATAAHVARLLVELLYEPRLRVSVDATGESNMVSLYDVVTLTTPLGPSADGLGWTDKRFAVVGIDYGIAGNTLALLEV